MTNPRAAAFEEAARVHWMRIAAGADRMARKMGLRFIIAPERLEAMVKRDVARALATAPESQPEEVGK
jgi:hypothetical protein